MRTGTMEIPDMSWSVGHIDRIPPGEGRRVLVGAEEVAVFRTRTGEVYAVQATCPHLGGSLADGIIGAGKVTCPLHGYVFELASGKAVKNSCDALRTYPVRVSDAGEVLITTGAGLF